jgi:hypothetical protein
MLQSNLALDLLQPDLSCFVAADRLQPTGRLRHRFAHVPNAITAPTPPIANMTRQPARGMSSALTSALNGKLVTSAGGHW